MSLLKIGESPTEDEPNEGYVIWIKLDTNPNNWLKYIWGCKTVEQANKVHADLLRGNRQVIDHSILWHEERPV